MMSAGQALDVIVPINQAVIGVELSPALACMPNREPHKCTPLPGVL